MAGRSGGEAISPIDLLASLLAEPADLSALRDERAWQAVKEHAVRYGVAALIAYAARSHVAPTERAWCDRVLVDSWMRHERMLGHLEAVLGILAGERIPTIALKGPLLARRYYKPALLRKPSMDLDVAVAERDLESACGSLVRAGYSQDTRISEALRQSHHVTLSHPSKPRVELHFRLTHGATGMPVEQFFERTVSVPLPSGGEARVLGPSDQLMHLALHLGHARFGTLFYLCEIRRVYGAEPESVRAEAIQRAVDHHFCGVLRMIDVAFRVRWGEPFLPSGTEVPATWLSFGLNEKLYRKFERWSMPGRPLSPGARLHGRWLDFLLTDGPTDALRLAAQFATIAGIQVWEKDAWRTTRTLRFAPAARAEPTPDPPGR